MARDESIDALRGLAIVLVVAGHALLFSASIQLGNAELATLDPQSWMPVWTPESIAFRLIYAFHLPLFGFVSGIVLRFSHGRRPLVRVRGRALSLLVPYLSWSIVLYPIALAFPATVASMPGPWVTTLIDTILGRDGLWYLYALFICSFVVSLVSCLHGWKWLLAGTVTIAIVWRSEMAFAVPDLFYLKDALWIYPFVVLGYLIWPAKAFMVKHRIGIAVSAGTAFAGLFWLRYPLRGTQLPPIESLAIVIHEHGLRGAFVLSMTIPYLCALAAVIALWAFYLGAEGRAIDAQAWLGRRSLGIYAIHSSVLWVMLNAGVTGVGVLIPISVAISAGITIGLERNHHSRFWLLGQSAKLPTLP